MKLTLVRGIPGSGKSTYARNNLPGSVLVESDMYHTGDSGVYRWNQKRQMAAVSWCVRTARGVLELGGNVVVANCFVTVGSMRSYIDMTTRLGVTVEVIRLDGGYSNNHSVPKSVIADMKSSFEDYPGEIYR